MHYFEIDTKYLTSCAVAYRQVKADGTNLYGTMGYVDHPSFAALRQFLGARGFIEIEDRWINGDRVLTPFALNGRLFEVDEKFCSATAQGVRNVYINRKTHGE